MYYMKNFILKGLDPEEYKNNVIHLEDCRQEALAYFEEHSQKHGGNIESMLAAIR